MKINVNRRNGSGWLRVLGAILIVVAFILMVWFLVRGQTSVSISNPEDIAVQSLNCTLSGVKYPMATYDGSVDKKITINAVFENSKIDSISLVYLLNYDDPSLPKKSETVNHAKMNEAFSESGIRGDTLSANYSYDTEYFRLSLYARGGAYGYNTARFFMLDAALSSMDEIKANYEKQGFSCVEKNA